MSVFGLVTRRRTFTMMWIATVISTLGFWLQDLTLGWLIAGATSSSATIALVPAMVQLPTVLLSLPAGAIADQVDRRKFLIGVQLSLVAVVGTFALTVLAGHVLVAGILLFAVLSGSLTAISAPARQAVLPSLVERHEIHAAVSLSTVSFNAARAIGPMIGGVLLTLFGPGTSLLTYAISCGLVAAALILWRQTATPVRQIEPIVPGILEGMRYVWRDGPMRRALGATGVYFFCASPIWAFAPVVAKHLAHGSSGTFSLFMISIGVGAVAGGLLGRSTTTSGVDEAIREGSLLSAVAMGLVALDLSLLPTLGAFF